MRVILFRHFEKSFSSQSDPALSPRGEGQASKLKESVLNKDFLPSPDLLIASPKKRAQQSFLPLSQALGQEIRTDIRLDERAFSQNESFESFCARIRLFLQHIETEIDSSLNCVYLCTHADWLEEFLSSATFDLRDSSRLMLWPSGHYESFDVRDSLWHHLFGGTI